LIVIELRGQGTRNSTIRLTEEGRVALRDALPPCRHGAEGRMRSSAASAPASPAWHPRRRDAGKPAAQSKAMRAISIDTRKGSGTGFPSTSRPKTRRCIGAMRVAGARLMLETTLHLVEVISRETRFHDPERMRRAFLRRLGQPPSVLRRAARG